MLVKLHIAVTDKALPVDLVQQAFPLPCPAAAQAYPVLGQVVATVRTWPAVAGRYGLSREKHRRLQPAFALAEV